MTKDVKKNIYTLFLFYLQSIPDDKVEIEFILAAGSTFEEAFDRWGSALRQYHGKDLQSQRDMARKYLGKKKIRFNIQGRRRR
jgi:hypothetical protein